MVLKSPNPKVYLLDTPTGPGLDRAGPGARRQLSAAPPAARADAAGRRLPALLGPQMCPSVPVLHVTGMLAAWPIIASIAACAGTAHAGCPGSCAAARGGTTARGRLGRKGVTAKDNLGWRLQQGI